jgi:hypothetical protein
MIQQCASASPSCACTFCTVNYHCPTCTRKPNVRAKCRLEAELKAKREAELRAIAKLEKDREERGQADELAGAMNEFFSALYVEDMVSGFDNRVSDSSTATDFPLASPDSITVTTEFGVVEESGTVTIISASGPSPHHQLFDNDTEDENNVEMTEDLNHEMPALQASLSQLHLPASQPPQHHNELDVETMQDVSEDEADIDTDSFDADAESAFIEEFLDHDENEANGNGAVLTPTATAGIA